ncbi:MAG TPA: hypothetical protein DCW31_04760 [Lactobacillus sp.]|nr:hypothetical protein [Lactobacillus sp.]
MVMGFIRDVFIIILITIIGDRISHPWGGVFGLCIGLIPFFAWAGNVIRHVWLFLKSPFGIVLVLLLISGSLFVLYRTREKWGSHCSVCNRLMSFGEAIKLIDGKICHNCSLKVGLDKDHESKAAASTMTVGQVVFMMNEPSMENPKQQWRIRQAREKVSQAQAQLKYESVSAFFRDHCTDNADRMFINDQRRQLFFDEASRYWLDHTSYHLYDYSDLVDYQLTISNVSIEKKSDGDMMYVNHILFSFPSETSITPAVKKIQLVIWFTGNREETFNILDRVVKRDSLSYSLAAAQGKKLISILEHVKQVRKTT